MLDKPHAAPWRLSGRLSLQDALALPRIAIESVEPVVEAGRFAAKAIAGQPVTVGAVVFTDGHELMAAQLLWRLADRSDWNTQPMTLIGNDHWKASFLPAETGRLVFAVEAWWDEYGTYCNELQKKHAAGLKLNLEIEEGRLHLLGAINRANGQQADQLRQFVELLGQTDDRDAQVALLLDDQTRQLMEDTSERSFRLRSHEYPLEVERPLAQFASWYELFPRSVTNDASRHGTFRDVIGRLPEIVAMGFDVVYFPPIHPIGKTHRKGRNNTLNAAPADPGSPYAIGSEEGGHESIHPELGSLDDFRELVAVARSLGLEVALDFAIQCSPDHPWLREHPEWFNWRPDGSLRYSENPPKKYEDIVNVDFYADGAQPGLWRALRDVVAYWVEQGVTLFRVDNPHTKPMPFWEWLIADIRAKHPEVIFLSEAFTRPAMMARLGKLGFSQSYTYFTWRNNKRELSQYFTELNEPPWRDCYRPNFFVNTPDINPFFLQSSGRAGFLIRAALATMGSGLWGMYSGFELCESEAIPGKEEYLHSEKYQIKPRNFRQPGNIVAEIARLNLIRRNNPALQTHLGFKPYNAWNDNILYFGKHTKDLSNFILVAISLDPLHAQECHFEIPLWEFDLPDDASLDSEDLMNGKRWTWHGKVQWMRLEPWQLPFGIWRIRPHGN